MCVKLHTVSQRSLSRSIWKKSSHKKFLTLTPWLMWLTIIRYDNGGFIIGSHSVTIRKECSISKSSHFVIPEFGSKLDVFLNCVCGYFVIVELFFPSIPSLLILLAQDNDTQIPNNPKPPSFPPKLSPPTPDHQLLIFTQPRLLRAWICGCKAVALISACPEFISSCLLTQESFAAQSESPTLAFSESPSLATLYSPFQLPRVTNKSQSCTQLVQQKVLVGYNKQHQSHQSDPKHSKYQTYKGLKPMYEVKWVYHKFLHLI